MGYSTQPSKSVLKKRLPANNRSIRELSLEEEILEATLQWWCQKAREQANDWQGDTARQVHTTLKSERERSRQLERELLGKDKAMAETAALLVLKK